MCVCVCVSVCHEVTQLSVLNSVVRECIHTSNSASAYTTFSRDSDGKNSIQVNTSVSTSLPFCQAL